jgi:SNF2 family DNA or RNA helicase
LNINQLPESFLELSALDQEWRVSKRVLDPILIIRRHEFKIQAVLSGKKIVKGVETIFSAPSNRHNWVLDGKIIRPLPSNIPSELAEALGPSENLTFSQAVALHQNLPNFIEVRFEGDVFPSATSVSKSLSNELAVPGLRANLFPYQIQGVQWMHSMLEHTGGVILADEMGLGKTLQVIALFLLHRPSPDEPALVLCPTSLITNWTREVKRFAPDLSILIHRGHNRAGTFRQLQGSEIVITTYETMVNDIYIFKALTWSYLICDEAQALKNPESGRRKAVSSLTRLKAIPVTGTPVENSLLDLWSLLDIAVPGLLGSKDDFSQNYPDTLESGQKLQSIADAYVLKRKVSDVAGDLPERIDVLVPLELGDELATHYCRVREETIEKYPVAGDLVATLQLQLFCAHPWLRKEDDLSGGEETIDRISYVSSLLTPKMERLVLLLKEAFINGNKVLVFAQFNRCADLIQEAATDLPTAYWNEINGSTLQEDRQSIIDEFTNHVGPGCLVLNPKAAGTGLNITAASVVIHYTPAWNPATEQQASARAHRRGQTQPVTIYKLYYEDTVESVMIERSDWRSQLANESVPLRSRDQADINRALDIRPKHDDQ